MFRHANPLCNDDGLLEYFKTYLVYRSKSHSCILQFGLSFLADDSLKTVLTCGIQSYWGRSFSTVSVFQPCLSHKQCFCPCSCWLFHNNLLQKPVRAFPFFNHHPLQSPNIYCFHLKNVHLKIQNQKGIWKQNKQTTLIAYFEIQKWEENKDFTFFYLFSKYQQNQSWRV